MLEKKACSSMWRARSPDEKTTKVGRSAVTPRLWPFPAATCSPACDPREVQQSLLWAAGTYRRPSQGPHSQGRDQDHRARRARMAGPRCPLAGAYKQPCITWYTPPTRKFDNSPPPSCTTPSAQRLRAAIYSGRLMPSSCTPHLDLPIAFTRNRTTTVKQHRNMKSRGEMWRRAPGMIRNSQHLCT